MYTRPVTLYIINPLYINAMCRFMFTCAGTPLALPDVYKRQFEYHPAGELGYSRLLEKQSWHGELENLLDRQIAVSYTHLDVYKRQVPSSLRKQPIIDSITVLTPL